MYRSRTRTTHYITHNDVEIKIDAEAYSEPIVEQVGNNLVVGYLVLDADCDDPMKSCDFQGEIISNVSETRRNSVVTDNKAALMFALKLNGSGWCDDSTVDIDAEFPCEPMIDYKGIMQKSTTLRCLAAEQYFETLKTDQDLLEKWAEEKCGELEDGQVYEFDSKALQADLYDSNGVYWEEVEDLAFSLYPKYWKQMVGPYVIPMSYNSGNYDTSITLDNWDGDYDDPPNAIWVAYKGAKDNIGSSTLPEGVQIKWHGAVSIEGSTLHAVVTENDVEVFDAGSSPNSWSRALNWARATFGVPSDEKVRATAEKYAEAVGKEYGEWASGNCFGCVIQNYEYKDGDWVEVGGESCWSFIGHEHATDSLKSDFFNPQIERMKSAQAELDKAQEKLFN